MTSYEITHRSIDCVQKALPKAMKTCIWLFEIILPVTLCVRLLQYYGILAQISIFTQPLFSWMGLPGESAIIFITSIFGSLYPVIAMITTMPMTLRAATILALMCLTSHNLIVESKVQAKTGSTFWGMLLLRLSMSFVIAFFLNLVMPKAGWPMIGTAVATAGTETFWSMLSAWLISSLRLILLIIVIVTSLMILHYILDEFNLMDGLSRIFAPLMRVLGLPRDTAFLWLVGNTVGLAYGSAIMVDQIDRKKLTLPEGDILNHHLAICHSLLEDTLLFVAIGIPVLWIICTRLVFSTVIVWLYRARRKMAGAPSVKLG